MVGGGESQKVALAWMIPPKVEDSFYGGGGRPPTTALLVSLFFLTKPIGK